MCELTTSSSAAASLPAINENVTKPFLNLPFMPLAEKIITCEGLLEVQYSAIKDFSLFIVLTCLSFFCLAPKSEGSLWRLDSVLLFLFVLGCHLALVSFWSGCLGPSSPLQLHGPLKPPVATARSSWWCATDVFTVRFQTAAFSFFRLFFLYLSSP